LRVAIATGGGGNPVRAVNGSVSVGTDWTALPPAACQRLTVINDSGVTLESRRDGGGAALRLPAIGYTFEALQDASELSFRRTDGGGGSVTLTYETEVL
jgi:hypothetical protein